MTLAYRYAPNSNRIRITHPDGNGNFTSAGTNSYVYDIENRLVSVTGAQNASFGYDPLGRPAMRGAGGARGGRLARPPLCL